jgi:hypothetical protein
MNLLNNVKITPVLGYYAAGVTERKAGTIIDMAGYEGCLFLYFFGTLLETSVLNCWIYGNSTSATGGTKLTTATVAHTVTAANALLVESAIAIDVYQPTPPASFRYLEASIDPDTANAVILGIVAIQYNGKLKPDANAVLINSKVNVFPAAS